MVPTDDAVPATGPDAAAPTPATTSAALSSAWPYLLIAAVGLFILLPKLGAFGFWDPWEPKYGETVREMIDRGSYWVPYYRDDVRLAKPILVYWGILAGSSVFGLNEFGARIVGVLLAVGTMLGTYYVVSSLRGRQAGLLSALVLATTPQFFLIARQAMPDVYLFTTVGSCLLFFCMGLYGPGRRRDLHFAVSYACFALAVLAKGPIVAGAIAFGTVALFALAHLDPALLWTPGHRLRSVGLTAAALGSAVGSALLAGVALAFARHAVPPSRLGKAQERLAGLVSGLHLADIVLVLLALAAGGLIWFLLRRPRAGGRLRVPALVLPALVAVGALAALVLAGRDGKILVAAVLGATAALGVAVVAAVAFLLQPHLRPAVDTWTRPIVRQVVLFVIVFAVVAGPWHVVIVLREGSEYFTYFILRHNVQRAAEQVNQTAAADFYARILTFGLFPWSAWVPVALASLVGFGDRRRWRERGLESFMLLACAVTVAAFSISVTKFAHYLAPLVVPISVVVGLTLHRTLALRRSAWSSLAWVAALLLFLLPAIDLARERGAIHFVESFTVKRFVPEELTLGLYQALMVAMAVIMLLTALARSRILVGALVACAVLMANHANAVFIPALSPQKTMRNLCETWKREATRGEPIGFYGDLKHGIYFYTDYQVTRLIGRPAFMEFMEPSRGAFCVMERSEIADIDDEFRRTYPGFRLQVVDSSHFDYNLVRSAALPHAAVERE